MATAASSRLGPLKSATRPAIRNATPAATAKGAQSGPGIVRSMALLTPSATATTSKQAASVQMDMDRNR